MTRISEDDILDAAERVVKKSGFAGLSIGAVAKEAGVSKSRVVYDHESKAELIAALVGRGLQQSQAIVQDHVANSIDTPNPELFGRIEATERMLAETDRDVAMAVIIASSSEDDIQDLIRSRTKREILAIQGTEKPNAALMSYLAWTGFMFLEQLNFHHWSEADRQKILSGLKKVYLTFDGEAHL